MQMAHKHLLYTPEGSKVGLWVYLAALSLISHFIPMDGHSAEPDSKKKAPYTQKDSKVGVWVYGELDYLLWFANEDGLHYPTVATGKSPELDSNWDSGVRAAIGAQRSCWDTKLCYTYYTTSSSGKANANIETILSSCPSTSGLFEVKTRWELNFNRLDWEIGRQILVGRHFVVRPFLGLEGLDVGQKFHMKAYSTFLDLDEDLPATNVVNSRNKSSFLSIGTRAGFDALFRLGAGFAFYGNFSGAILWGNFRIKQKYDQTDFYSSRGPTELVDQTKQRSQNSSIFNCDLGVGFNWNHCFQKSGLELLLKLGWEQHYYTDLVRFQDFYLQMSSAGTAAYSSNGNLSLSGFAFGASLGY